MLDYSFGAETCLIKIKICPISPTIYMLEFHLSTSCAISLLNYEMQGNLRSKAGGINAC